MPRKVKAKDTITINCEQCGKQLVQTRLWQRFCSRTCREQYHVEQTAAALKQYQKKKPKRKPRAKK